PVPMPAPVAVPQPLPVPRAHLANHHRVPAAGAQAPTMLGGDALLLPQPLAAHDALLVPHGTLPSTIPGQGVIAARPSHGYGYPSAAELPLHAQQLHVHAAVPRDATSTALVQPQPYGMLGSQAPAPYVQPQLSRRAKMVLGGAALTMFAAIATIAIIKGSTRPAPQASPGSTTTTTTTTTSKGPIVESITPDASAPTRPIAKTEPLAKVAVPDAEPTPKVEPPKPIVKVEPPKPIVKVEPSRVEAAKPIAKVEPPRLEPSRAEPKKETKLERRRRLAREREERVERVERTPTVAVADPVTPKRTIDAGDARVKADRLYRDKKFNEAAAVLRSASSVGGSDGSDLKSAAAVYEQVGRNFNVGMGPATKPTEAYDALNRAANLDRGAGGAFSTEIQTKLAQVAPRAAVAFMAAKDFSKAFQAARAAETFGGGNPSTKSVRSALEDRAGELYATALKELDANPDAAKSKLREIKSIVDGKSPWYVKATKALAGG
ncbi:MAG: hypothetical protein M3680_18895, partial [Myxococcota bacterium]|nr:hypothetical protein [Myxococcota bacterium]